MTVFSNRPMSLPERSELARRLRQEAAAKIAEAERIEAGIKADNEAMIETIRKVLESSPPNLSAPDA